jgi:hypothetical protein
METSTDCKDWTMSILKDLFDHTSKEIFFYSSHALSTNHNNIHIIFLGILNYGFSYCIIFLKYSLFYINFLFLGYKVSFIKQALTFSFFLFYPLLFYFCMFTIVPNSMPNIYNMYCCYFSLPCY